MLALFQAGIDSQKVLQIYAVRQCVAQNQLYKSEVSKENEKKEHQKLSLNKYLLSSYTGILDEAAFDTKDPFLDSKVGACSTCHFNSSFASLFPDEEHHSRCNYVACFKNKEVLHVQREIQTCVTSPTILLAYESRLVSENVAKIFNDEGIVAHKFGYGEPYREVHQPQIPTWDEFQTQSAPQGLNKRQIRERFKKAGEDYSKAITLFDKNVSIGKYKRALIVDSNYPGRKGKYMYLEEFTKTGANSKKPVLSQADSTLEDINGEIERINQREIRAKELDEEKVHRKVVRALIADKSLQAIPTKSNMSDRR